MRETPVTIDGKVYNLCGDFQALIDAEAHFAARIHGFNLADVIFNWGRDADSILAGSRLLLPCALHAFHPEVDFDEAQGMVDRALAADDAVFFEALWAMFPPITEETQDALDHLALNLDAVAEGNEFFEGKPGLAMILVEAPWTLSHVWRVFPCALHRHRPELSLDEARQLMTLPAVVAVLGLFGLVWQSAPEADKDKFVQRVADVTSDEDKQEFLFRVMAKEPWPDVPRA